ncbi:MAG: glycosyltransferase [Armatimonadetes bacterium]|nr:glycosyltransferase [Armatimonadota bacterium]
MADRLLASIVIDNYNYGHFIRETIDSALSQTYAPLEIIVVDDGSTDDSREIIRSYGDRVKAIFKENGGQASAFNAGFDACQGNIIFFLDSDDTLFPHAAETVMACFTSSRIAKVHWPLWVVDEKGNRTGQQKPSGALSEGDLRSVVLESGPTSCISSPTSGNTWTREFLEKVLPVPEESAYYRVCADEYLYTLAPVFGSVKMIPEPLGTYRIHDKNIYSSRTFEEKLQLELAGHAEQCRALSRTLQRHGIPVDLEAWERNSWFHRLDESIRELRALIPEDRQFVLVEDGTWGMKEIFGSRAHPLMEREGESWGSPVDSEQAIREIREWMRRGVDQFALAWPAFWWRDQYPELMDYLEGRGRKTADNERLLLFDLRGNP